MSLDADDQLPNPLQGLVKLISSTGHEFIISRECALASGTIRGLLHGPGRWSELSGPIPSIVFETINTATLEKVIQYFYYKRRYDRTPPPLPPFNIDTEQAVQLLMAANFLDA